MIAITGPQGCGLTSYLQQLLPHLDTLDAWRYGELTYRPKDIKGTLTQLCELVGCERPLESAEELVEYIKILL